MKWKTHDLNHDLTFSAHTFNCVCHSIRSMFRVLGVYNFAWFISFYCCYLFLPWEANYAKPKRVCLPYTNVSTKFWMPLALRLLHCTYRAHQIRFINRFRNYESWIDLILNFHQFLITDRIVFHDQMKLLRLIWKLGLIISELVAWSLDGHYCSPDQLTNSEIMNPNFQLSFKSFIWSWKTIWLVIKNRWKFRISSFVNGWWIWWARHLVICSGKIMECVQS